MPLVKHPAVLDTVRAHSVQSNGPFHGDMAVRMEHGS